MAILDENTDIIDQSDVSFMPTALRYGLIGGGIMAVLTLLSGVLELSTSTAGTVISTVLSIGTYIWIVYAAIKQHRDQELGGFITMGRAFLVGWIPVIITALIAGIVTYLYFNFIDPSAIDVALEQSAEMMEGFGMTEEQIEAGMEGARDGFGLVQMVGGSAISGGILGAIISGITGAVMKKEAPMIA